MLIGEVTSDKQAVIRLAIQDAAGRVHEIPAVLDTGFTEHLTLPSDLVAALMLPLSYSAEMSLADGSDRILPVHTLRVEWENQVVTIPVHVADGVPLLGMSLLYGSSVNLVVLDGGKVTIEPV